jgi:hypothetical protein
MKNCLERLQPRFSANYSAALRASVVVNINHITNTIMQLNAGRKHFTYFITSAIIGLTLAMMLVTLLFYFTNLF